MAKFTPRDDMDELLPVGEYDAVVIAAEETESKAGSPMFKVTLEVYGDEGRKLHVFEYLLLEGAASWKLKAFCRAAGLMDRYKAGEINEEDLQDAPVRVKLEREAGNGDFPPKNVVRGYLTPKGDRPRQAPEPEPATVGDDDGPPF